MKKRVYFYYYDANFCNKICDSLLIETKVKKYGRINYYNLVADYLNNENILFQQLTIKKVKEVKEFIQSMEKYL